MKRTLILMTLALIMFPVLAVAQQLNGADHVVARVPFQFMLGSQMVPAGTYVVLPAINGGSNVFIQNPTAKIGVATSAIPDEGKKSREGYSLIFHKYGDTYILAGIGLPGWAVDRLPEGKLETELRAQGNASSTELVAALR